MNNYCFKRNEQLGYNKLLKKRKLQSLSWFDQVLALTCLSTAISPWMLLCLHQWRLCITVVMCHWYQRNCATFSCTRVHCIVQKNYRKNQFHSLTECIAHLWQSKASALWHRQVFWRMLSSLVFSRRPWQNLHLVPRDNIWKFKCASLAITHATVKLQCYQNY